MEQKQYQNQEQKPAFGIKSKITSNIVRYVYGKYNFPQKQP
jgi:hypothetical protein